MIKKIGIILFFAAVVGAGHAVPLQGLPLLSDTAFADSYTQDGKPCPPECVSDSMEIVTWYPSPYNEYEELRLYPKRSAEESQCNSFEQLGLMYYNQDEQALKVCRFDPAAGYRWELVNYWKLDSSGNISNVNSSGKIVTGALQLSSGAQADYVLTSDASGNAAWKSSSASGGTKLVQYDFSTSQPACNSSNIGLMVFDSSSNRPYVCDNSGKWLTSNWTDKDMVMTLHSSTQCSSAGGTVVADGSGNKFCRFNLGACPSGWLKYDNWTTTQSVTYWYCSGGDYTDSTGGHSWSNSPVETRTFTHRCGAYNRCECQASASASITQIGCY